MSEKCELVQWFDEVGKDDAGLVGGKGASLGEMYRNLCDCGVLIPNGFNVNVEAYALFVDADVTTSTWDNVAEPAGMADVRTAALESGTLADALEVCLADADPSDHLDMHGRAALARALVLQTPIPDEVRAAVAEGYARLCDEYGQGVDVAVRSSATTEDSAEASFAGQYDSYLNVHGVDSVVEHWRRCVASLFNERAICYQLEKGLDPLASALSVVVMKMVRSDLAASGVMFSIDPDSGHRGVIHIASAYGLGELVVQGSISPDTFTVWKEGLRRGNFAIVHRHLGSKDRRMVYSDDEVQDTRIDEVPLKERRAWSIKTLECRHLAEMALNIEEHYGAPMDIEWAKDGVTNELYIVQARPETVHARNGQAKLERYMMAPELIASLKGSGKVLATGQAVGKRIGSGKVRLYKNYEEVLERRRAMKDRLADGVKLDEI
ncbi:MAG: hypothetical protein DSY88_05425, partial [Candidatus Poseidoniales archaeon]